MRAKKQSLITVPVWYINLKHDYKELIDANQK